MMRVSLYLSHRKLLQSKAIAIENDLRGVLRNSGLKVGMDGTVRFEARIRELVEWTPTGRLEKRILPLPGHQAARLGCYQTNRPSAAAQKYD
jgi:hypothetical protein